jgi:hypothetical protein
MISEKEKAFLDILADVFTKKIMSENISSTLDQTTAT